MVDQELLDILVCPETKQSLRLADANTLDRLNSAIAEGTVSNRGGDSVTDRIDEALIRKDDAVLYPIRDDIPIMLVDEAIPLPEATR